jgi:hypothetical protein
VKINLHLVYEMVSLEWRFEMDYIEAELEARIFPSVDLDPRDWEDEDMYIMPGDRNDPDSNDDDDEEDIGEW